MIDDVNQAEAVERLVGFAHSGVPHRLFTPKPEIVMQAHHDPAYRSILNAADLAIPDGIGLVLASRIAGTRLRAHVRGTDVVLELAARSASEGWRGFLLGAENGVAAAAGEVLKRRYPGIDIVGAMPGSPDASGDQQSRDAIRAVAPVHVLLVAYGAPRQEQWIARNQEAVGACVQIGVGGVLNFIAGRSPRAPRMVRRLELEWAYRLATEPWRWRRQLALPIFAALATKEAIHRRRRPR